MENTNEKNQQLFLNADYKPTNKNLSASHISLQNALVEQNDNITKSEKIFVRLAMASADIIYFQATKKLDLNKADLSIQHLPLYGDVEEQLLTVVKNLCTTNDELDEERLAKLKGSFQTALRCAYLVVGKETGYKFGLRKNATSKADKGILNEKAIKHCKDNGIELVNDCFYIPSKTFSEVIDKDAGKDDNGEWKTRPNTNNLTMATRNNIDDSYQKFVMFKEMADNNAEFKKLSNPRNNEKNETVVIPESYVNYKKLLLALTNNLVQNLPTNDQSESNQLSEFIAKEDKQLKAGSFPKQADNPSKNQKTILEILVTLSDTIDQVITNVGNEEKITDIIQGDLKATEQSIKDKLVKDRLANKDSSKASKSAVKEELKKSA
tara:strand:+ start:160 stop:1299 length:1140 start_codon:yes stop_codon:yes gene_type:complete